MPIVFQVFPLEKNKWCLSNILDIQFTNPSGCNAIINSTAHLSAPENGRQAPVLILGFKIDRSAT